MKKLSGLVSSRLVNRRRRKLGQHVLVSDTTARNLVEHAGLRETDTVFEIGTGLGIITKHIAPRVSKVVSCDIEMRFVEKSRTDLSVFPNISFVVGDAFTPPLRDTAFDVCITSLPYSRSRDFIEWLFARANSFRSSTAIVQEEFVNKLQAQPGEDNYRAVSVIAQMAFDIKRHFLVTREEFDPPPKVLSHALSLFPKRNLEDSFIDRTKQISIIKQVFSFRGRLLRVAARHIPEINGLKGFSEEFKAKRVEQLSPSEFSQLLGAVLLEKKR